LLNDIAIPILPCRNLGETLHFYQRLGFTIVGRDNAPDPYGIVRRDGIELHFFEYRDLEPASSIAGCFIRVKDADALFAEYLKLGLAAQGIPRLGPLADMPWGMREFHLVDADGNLLRIGHALPA